MGHLVSPSAAVVKEQKHRIVPTALNSALVGRFQQRIQLVLLPVPEQGASDLFELDGRNLAGPFQVFRAVQADESRPGMDRRETLIPCGEPAAAILLQMLEESSGAGHRPLSGLLRRGLRA